MHMAWVGFLAEPQVSSVALDKTLNLLERAYFLTGKLDLMKTTLQSSFTG